MVVTAVVSPPNAVASLTVVGTFEGMQRAEQVLQTLQEAGFAPDSDLADDARQPDNVADGGAEANDP